MRKQLIDLREKMRQYGIDAYLIPTTDFHGSEYVNDYFKCRKYVSGFTGSAGTIVVTDREACLWTDGRYFLQARNQLAGSGIDLMKMGQPGVPTVSEYLKKNLKAGNCLGFDGRVVDWTFATSWKRNFHCVSIWIWSMKSGPIVLRSIRLPSMHCLCQSPVKQRNQRCADCAAACGKKEPNTT